MDWAVKDHGDHMTEVRETRVEDAVEQPILNTPYAPPDRHWQLDPVTWQAQNVVLDGRRLSGDYLPVPRSRSARGRDELALPPGGNEPYDTINEIRRIVEDWVDRGYPGVTEATHGLLDHWERGGALHRPYFCQRNAMEIIIWLHEAGEEDDPKTWKRITDRLKRVNQVRNDGLPRLATKMATGTGKTQLMQMLIAWRAANSEIPIDVLAITPGLTVKERLQELKPTMGDNYDHLVPSNMRAKVNTAQVSVINFQAFQHRDRSGLNGERLTGTSKKLIRGGGKTKGKRWEENDAQLLNRLLRRAHGDRPLIILNDEAHHCYAPPEEPVGRVTREDREYENVAALWFNALRMIHDAGRIEAIYDFSATPMYLRKPADLYSELFPWTVSDYPLIEAIEAGLTKIPRVPVDDDSDQDEPVFRELYQNAEPKRIDPDNPPEVVRELLNTMHRHYQSTEAAIGEGGTPPVMIVVVNSIQNANALYQYIAGGERDGRWMPGQFEEFSNVESDRSGPKSRPPTLLVHSDLDAEEGGTGVPANVLKLHAPNAKNLRARMEKIRRIFSTVGKFGGEGEHIRCVISVSMLTEGWDARTVTHIFGFRPFSTQLLCEQVVGRGLRRSHFDPDGDSGHLRPQVVNVFGVPFSFMRATAVASGPQTHPYSVHVLNERTAMEIRFPRVHRYRITTQGETLRLNRDKVEPYRPKAGRMPTRIEMRGVAGKNEIIATQGLSRQRVLLLLAREVVGRFDIVGKRKLQLIRSAVGAVEDWLTLVAEDLDERQRRQPWVLLGDPKIPDLIAKACERSDEAQCIIPTYADQFYGHGERFGTTADVGFVSGNPRVIETVHSHVNKAPCDSSPELTLARCLDKSPDVGHWVRNEGLGFQIPYTDSKHGAWRYYEPDFIAVLAGREGEPPIHLILEYKGVMDPDSATKIAAAKDMWVPAINGVRQKCDPVWTFRVLESPDTVAADLRRAITDVRGEVALATKSTSSGDKK